MKTMRFIIYVAWKILMQRFYDMTKNHIIETNGYKLKTVANDQGLSLELLIFKTHEPVVTHLVREEIKKGMVCIDIGGNIGYYVILESKLVGETGQVIVFEPYRTTYTHLLHNLELNNISNIRTYNTAIGDSNGSADFLITSHSNHCTVVSHPQTDNMKSYFAEALGITNPDMAIDVVKVPLMTLDSFLEKHPLQKVDFIRMDVEGYEHNIYHGMADIVKHFKPKIQLELHYSFMGIDMTTSLLRKMYEDGYEVKWCLKGFLDYPFIGNHRDVNFNITIKDIVDQINRRELHPYGTLELLLVPRS
jgi:FkbM family methyltransferase